MNILTILFGIFRDLLLVWGPFVGALALVVLGALVVVVGALFGRRTVRIAKANAATREARRTYAAYRAPVIDITDRLPSRSNIA